MNGDIQAASPAGQKKSNTWKWILGGCGCGCLVVIALITIISVVSVKYVKAKIEEYKKEFVEQGYHEIKSHIVQVTDEVDEKTLFIGQVVKIIADCNDDIAIIAQVGEIHSTINGKVSFRGQVLTIQPNAHIKGDIDVKAQAVQIFGTVDGEILGTYQQIVDQRQKE